MADALMRDQFAAGFEAVQRVPNTAQAASVVLPERGQTWQLITRLEFSGRDLASDVGNDVRGAS
ncbi:hypothetical protein GCM10009661_54060 [Catellatospora chokoriensis]|uniref:Uncharacterized protein n=1 Tax=Catellatospora chokoriensis TaxID=310353 RepID=A0A8J3K6J4_9ACTN|nr:hypothetical protein Cch02nite_50640 [Catellatospora chokoriensis]